MGDPANISAGEGAGTSAPERPPQVHILKAWPEPFFAQLTGEKTYEIRVADRDFRVGDLLVLRLYHPEAGEYGDGYLIRAVVHLTGGGEWGLPPGLVVMGTAEATAGIRASAVRAALRAAEGANRG